MRSDSAPPATVDDYIAMFPPDVQVALNKVRKTIRRVAPTATEKISYRMPSYHLDGALVYFGGFKAHIGFFPPVRDPALMKAAARFAGPKGNLRFPLTEPMPLALIAKLVWARVRENEARAAKNRPATRQARRG